MAGPESKQMEKFIQLSTYPTPPSLPKKKSDRSASRVPPGVTEG